MTFEEWFEKWWGERTDGPYKSINVESIARAAWEAAQAHDHAKAHAEPVVFAQVLENGDLRISANGLRVLSNKLDKSRVMQPLYLQPEPEVALLNNAVSAQPAMNNITSIEIKGLSHSICGGARKTEIGELLINGAADIGVLTGLINDLAHQQAVQELDCNGCSLDLPEIGSEMDDDIVGAHVIQDGAVYVLLVAPPEAERELAWADGNEDVHTSISDGYTNTYLLSQLYKVGDSHPAAEHCAKYKELGEYYLPSQLELAQIIANKDAVSRAGLKGWYWTSTQISTSAARNMNASSGSWGYFHKTYEIAVRPIRRIKLDGPISMQTQC